MNDVDDAEDDVERRTYGIPSSDRHIAVDDLLEDFGIGRKRLVVRDGLLEEPAGEMLVRMVGPEQVHRDVRVDEDHDLESGTYPRSISPSMCPMSPAGKACAEAARMAASFEPMSWPASASRADRSDWRTHSAVVIRRRFASR